MVSAEDTSWEFYIPQDYSARYQFLQGKNGFHKLETDSRQWEWGRGQGSCGDRDCGGNTTFPTGAMPTATIDTRTKTICLSTMLDGNVVDLTITPHHGWKPFWMST